MAVTSAVNGSSFNVSGMISAYLIIDWLLLPHLIHQKAN